MIFCDNIISRQNNGRMKGEIKYVTKKEKTSTREKMGVGKVVTARQEMKAEKSNTDMSMPEHIPIRKAN